MLLLVKMTWHHVKPKPLICCYKWHCFDGILSKGVLTFALECLIKSVDLKFPSMHKNCIITCPIAHYSTFMVFRNQSHNRNFHKPTLYPGASFRSVWSSVFSWRSCMIKMHRWRFLISFQFFKSIYPISLNILTDVPNKFPCEIWCKMFKASFSSFRGYYLQLEAARKHFSD